MTTTIMLVEDEHGLADSIATELGFLNYQVISQRQDSSCSAGTTCN